MKPKKLSMVLTLEAVVCIVTCIFNFTLKTAFTSIITFPFEQIGTGLRVLSLWNNIGNVISLIIYISLCILPVAYLCYRVAKKKNKGEDGLLVILSVLLFFVLYLMINPAYINSVFATSGMTTSGMTTMGKVILCDTVYSVIIGYAVCRLLRKFALSDTVKLLNHLKVLMVFVCIVIVYSIAGEGVNGLLLEIQNVKAGNTEMTSSLSITYFFLVFKFIFSVIPTALGIVIVFFANTLIEELKINRYSDGVIIAANKLGSICKKVVAAMMLSSIVTNLVQLIFGKVLLTSNYTTQIPIISILLVLIVLLFSQYFVEFKALKNDNDMFI